MKHPVEDHLLNITRRQFFGKMAQGIGTMALGSMLSENLFAAGPSSPFERGFLGSPHFAPKAKRIIYLFQHGGPSQMDLFDPKPMLQKYDGEAFPGELKFDNVAEASSKVFGSPGRSPRAAPAAWS